MTDKTDAVELLQDTYHTINKRYDKLVFVAEITDNRTGLLPVISRHSFFPTADLLFQALYSMFRAVGDEKGFSKEEIDQDFARYLQESFQDNIGERAIFKTSHSEYKH